METIFGQRIACGARSLLESKNFRILTNPKSTRFLAIIETNDRNCKGNSKGNWQLYPFVNYCVCKYFQVHVLCAKQSLKGHNNNSTCKHVLALHLVLFLEKLSKRRKNVQDLYKLKYEILPSAGELNSRLLGALKPPDEAYIIQNISVMKYDPGDDTSEFIGHLDNIKTFANSLNALNISDYAFIQIDKSGFRCTVEQNKCVQANLFLTPMCFTEYHIGQERVCFTININTLYECLSIYSGTECSLKMSYSEINGALQLLLVPQNEYNIITECSIRTISFNNMGGGNDQTVGVGNDIMDLSLIEDENNPLNTVYVCGSDLSNIFNGFDKTTEEFEIFLSPVAPYFQITALGVQQSKSQVEVNSSSNILTLFNCKKNTRARYKATFIRLIQKSLADSSRAVLKTNASGLLEIHCMMLEEDNIEIYIQYYITSMIADE